MLIMCLFSQRSLESDSSHLSVLWFIEMYCWKCTGHRFLPTQAGPPPFFSLVLSLFPVGYQFCRIGVYGEGRGGSVLVFYLLAMCVCACVCAYAGDAADVADDDQGDE